MINSLFSNRKSMLISNLQKSFDKKIFLSGIKAL